MFPNNIHMIGFVCPIIPFSNSFLTSHYSLNIYLLFLMTWIHTQHWVPGWMPTFCQKGRLGWRRPYVLYTVWRELGTKTIEQRRLTDGRVRLDWLAAVGVAGHGHGRQWCHRDQWPLHAARPGLDYYSIQITWLVFFCPIILATFFFKCLLFLKKFHNNVRVPWGANSLAQSCTLPHLHYSRMDSLLEQ